jgi:hypothetical protein
MSALPPKVDMQQVHSAPRIAEARDATLKAMKEAEVGWQRAVDKIGERASPCAWTAQGSN